MDIFSNSDPLRGFEFIKTTERVASLIYNGKSLSLNSFYSQGHWSKRSNIKKEFKAIFIDLFNDSEELRVMDKFFLIMYCNNRLDVDNNIGLEKVFMDTLRAEGYIKDDSKKFFKGVIIFIDDYMEKGTVEFHLYERIKNDKG